MVWRLLWVLHLRGLCELHSLLQQLLASRGLVLLLVVVQQGRVGWEDMQGVWQVQQQQLVQGQLQQLACRLVFGQVWRLHSSKAGQGSRHQACLLLGV
jgi:hypothetical protein